MKNAVKLLSGGLMTVGYIVVVDKVGDYAEKMVNKMIEKKKAKKESK